MTVTQEPYRSENILPFDKFVAGTSPAIASLSTSLTTAKVHVSACGRHFVALLGACRLLVVYDFEKVSNEEELYTQTLDIQIASHRLYESIYLAFDYGRISVVTVRELSFSVTAFKNLFFICVRPMVSSLLK
jgi:hypothetical protein